MNVFRNVALFWMAAYAQAAVSAVAVTSQLEESRILLFDDYALTNNAPPTWVHEGAALYNPMTAGLLPCSNHYHRTGWVFLNCRMGQRYPSPPAMYIPPQMSMNYIPSVLTTNYSAHLMNTLDAAICSPIFTNGIGTVYFEAINSVYISQVYSPEFAVDIATNMIGGMELSGDMTDANVDWQFAFSKTLEALTPNDFIRVAEKFDISQPAALRIRRANIFGPAIDNQHICIDNIRVSPSAANIVLSDIDAVVDSGGTFVACDVSNASGAPTPTDHTTREVQLCYRWFSPTATGAWQQASMAYQPATGTDGDGERWETAGIPFTPASVLEYYFVVSRDTIYQSPDYTEQGYAYAPETGVRYPAGGGTFWQTGGDVIVSVTFDAQGGEVSPTGMSVTVSLPYGMLPTPVKAGHTFEGWALDGAPVTETTTVTAATNHTLTAGWAEDTYSYTVTFNGNGGMPDLTNITQTAGSPYVFPSPHPTREGYAFAGWADAANGGEWVSTNAPITGISDHTLYAQWNQIPLSGTTWYVDADRPDDSGSGLTWATAKQTIQAAINISAGDNTIIVTNGVYAPITTDNKAITIISVNGAEHTVIDGGGTNRCAMLGGYTNTILMGFTLRNGWATSHGGGAFGGTLSNCTLTNNTTTSYGGGAIYSTLNNCMLTGNTATRGGGTCGGNTLNNCVLTGNTATQDGGGAFDATLNNCVLTGNKAGDGGGASKSTLNNCTVTGNRANLGGGTYQGTVKNCIVWGNLTTGGVPSNYSSYCTYTYSCTFLLPDGEGNTDADPLFVDAANGDFRLQAGSPCIDTGSNDYADWEFDFDGNPRIRNGTVDMGAYEYQGEPQTPDPDPYLSDPEDAEDAAPLLITTAYDGFLYDTNNTVRGTVTLKATAKVKADKKTGIATTNWTVSAKAVMQAASVSFSGKPVGVLEHFDVTTKNGERLDVFMQGDRFFGTVSGGKVGGTFTVDGARAVFADKKDEGAKKRLDEFRGVYNVALMETDNHPSLPRGYVSLTVGNLGSVKYAGLLSDGTKVSGSGKLLDGLSEETDNHPSLLAVALFRPLYSKKGFIGGLLWIDADTQQVLVDTDYDWLVDWVYADPQKVPFAYALDVLGGYFGNGTTAVPAPSGLSFSAFVETDDYPSLPNIIGGRWIEEAFPLGLLATPSGLKLSIDKGAAPKKPKGEDAYDYEAVRDRNPALATLSYTAKTGVFKGKFNLYYDGLNAKGALQHKAVSVPYAGLMIPHEGALIGLGTGTATVNKRKHGIPVFLGN